MLERLASITGWKDLKTKFDMFFRQLLEVFSKMLKSVTDANNHLLNYVVSFCSVVRVYKLCCKLVWCRAGVYGEAILYEESLLVRWVGCIDYTSFKLWDQVNTKSYRDQSTWGINVTTVLSFKHWPRWTDSYFRCMVSKWAKSVTSHCTEKVSGDLPWKRHYRSARRSTVITINSLARITLGCWGRTTLRWLMLNNEQQALKTAMIVWLRLVCLSIKTAKT